MSLPDFASVVPMMRAHVATGEAAVIATIVAQDSPLTVVISDRLVVHADGTTTGAFPDELMGQVTVDALLCLAEKRSRLLSYRIEDTVPTPVGIQQGDLDVYYEVLDAPPRLIVVGGGHIAVPLVRIASLLGYTVTVLDDRPEYATEERFPDASLVLCGPYSDTLSGQKIDANTYIVLVTRGHVHDAACLERVIHSPARYIGMIGSKKRVRTVLEHVLGSQPPPQQVRHVYAPIGIDLGATTPDEIAVSIGAELVKVRRGGKAESLSRETIPRV